jgi:hypothetical protein
MIYRLFGRLGKEFKFDVHEWNVEKENQKTFTIVSNNSYGVKKRLNKEKIGVIDTNTVNTIDSIISYNVFLTDKTQIDHYKNEILNKIIERVRYYDENLKQKVKMLQENGINID